MKTCCLFVFTSALAVSTAAFAADDGEMLFKKSGCSVCHAVAKKLVGPSFKDIAAKYKGDRAAPARLAQKVRMGGSGSFGIMPMPPAPKTISDQSIKTIVEWVLNQK